MDHCITTTAELSDVERDNIQLYMCYINTQKEEEIISNISE